MLRATPAIPAARTGLNPCPMARRKGETTSRQIDRDLPHQVEVPIPPGGLGRRLDAMHDLARELGRYAARPGDRR